MVQIKKLVADPKPNVAMKSAKSGSMLSRVQPVLQVDSGGIKVSLYGRGKTGKTRLISTFPKPIIIIGGEDGTRSIRTINGIDFIPVIIDGSKNPPKNGKFIYLNEMEDFIDEIRSSKYATAAIDTASSLSDIFLANILGLSEIPAQKSWGMASREDYGQLGMQMKTVLRKVLQLPTNVVITAHERNFDDDMDSDLIFPSVGSALSPAVAGWLDGAAEYICQTFIREETETTEIVIGKGSTATKEKVINKTGNCEYCLRMGPHPVYKTGFRLPPGFTLPDFTANPTYEKIMQITNGKYTGRS